MTPINGAIHGAIFVFALSILVFFLKVICPIDSGCLVDPFLLILFYPLSFLNTLGIVNLIPMSYEPFLILFFWTLSGFIVGWIIVKILPKDFFVEVEEEEGI